MWDFTGRLWRDEDGAVTVDWVVLTAGLVGLGLAVVLIVQTAAQDPADGVGAALSSMTVGL